MSNQRTYINVILPLRLPQLYTYGVPFELVEDLALGKRVVVQFGRTKIYTALIAEIHHYVPDVRQIKPIESILDEEPIIDPEHLDFWKWMSHYYLCTEGEVMQAALPSALKLSSETRIVLHPEFDGDFTELDDKAYLVAEVLMAQREMNVSDVQKILDQKVVFPVLRQLVQNGVALYYEELKDKYKPKTEKHVRFAEHYRNEDNLREAFDALERAPKQLEVAMSLYQLSARGNEVSKSKLMSASGADHGRIKALVEKGIIEEYEVEKDRLPSTGEEIQEHTELSPHQQKAFEEMQEQFEENEVCLLHGVTSSGKTHLYFEWIKKTLDEGKQVLFLMPEIALTAQMVQRLRKHFGDMVGVYHSRFNDQERVEIWNKVLDGTYRLVIGARSSLFLPHRNLGLIIVDEEHDGSFKQFDPAPRYQGRDCAIMLGHRSGAKVILGSATPSVESLFNAREKKYGFVHMSERFGGKDLPEIHIIDLGYMVRSNRMRDQYSIPLLDAMKDTLNREEQVILFQNRRGYSPYLTCGTCGWIPYCKQCDVRLTYHKFRDRLVCHYCGYHEATVKKCKACGSMEMQIRGSGTQKLEDDLEQHFPMAKIERLDWDAARSKNAHEEIIGRFERKEVDILVGTQMVTKGLDFDHVGLVGIVQADQLWSTPNFRANERAFQLIQQVAGRAGRKHGEGQVYIQTYKPDHWVLEYAREHNLKKFYHHELENRREFGYPPYQRLIQITLKHKQVQKVENAAYFLAGQLRKNMPQSVLGPTIPGISRIKNQYLRDIMVKSLPTAKVLHRTKILIQQAVEKLEAHKELKSVQVHMDVDP